MWVYVRDVIDKNRFHNCVREFSSSVNKKELLPITSVETKLNKTIKQDSYLIQLFYSELLRYN